MPVFLLDIELSGAIAVDAPDKHEAEAIADSISLNDLSDFLLETRARVIEILDNSDKADQRVFSRSDV